MIRRLKQWLKKKPESVPEASTSSTELEQIIGFTIPDRDRAVFNQALRHRSIIDDDKYKAYETYERLEFLGDTILDLVISEHLFELYPEENEGFLTKLRAKLVRGETLAHIARQMRVNELLEVGTRAEVQKIEFSKSVLADVFEALVAAIYLTKGYTFTRDYVLAIYSGQIDLKKIESKVENHKSVLMELMQSRKMPLPEYEIVSEEGPGHDKTFEVAVRVNGELMGKGRGKNKKEAEQQAAKEAFVMMSDQ